MATVGVVLVLLTLVRPEGDATTTPTEDGMRGAVLVQAARLLPGRPVPAPTGPVVLTVRNAPNANVGTDLRLDLKQLESLELYSYVVDDRDATGRTVSFSGPLLRSVLELAGETGQTIHAEALNDYRIDIPTSDALDYPVLLATRADGATMTVANYGPTRVVYPTAEYELDRSVYDARWIWQLRSIEVE